MRNFIQKLIISIIAVLFMAGFSKLFSEPSIWHYLSLLLLILLFYYLFLPLLKKIWAKFSKLYRSYFPKIGILNGNIYSPIREYKFERSCTNVTASMWALALKKSKIEHSVLITTSQISNSYSIIINPFGDSFPEQDTKLHKTFYSICEFVENGGIFIVTGGAFFAHQNPINSSKNEWVITKITEGIQSVSESFLYLEFGIQTTGDQFKDGKLVFREPTEIEIYQKPEDQYLTGKIDIPAKVKRFRAAMPSTSNYIPFIREKDDKSYPIVAVPYGKGYLIHAGLFLESEMSDELMLIVKIISNLIVNRLKIL